MTGPILAIEISNTLADRPDDPVLAPGVGVLLGGDTWVHEPIAPAQRHDDALLPAIQRACSRAGVTSRELERVGVSMGPGGYSSCRIAVTVAKSIALATASACVGVPTAHAVARATLGPGEDALLALAWKRDDAWVQPFAGHTPQANGRLIALERLPDLLSGAVLIAEPALIERMSFDGAHRPPVFSAHAIASLAREMDPVEPERLLPLYPREPEAVTKWRALHPS